MSVAPDIVKAAVEVYNLEVKLANGLNEGALEKAIEAVLERHERNVLDRLATQIETMVGNRSDSDPAATAMWNFAEKLREGLDKGQYSPTQGDVVEISITGQILDITDKHQVDDGRTYSVEDDKTGQEFVFYDDDLPHMRVLTYVDELFDV